MRGPDTRESAEGSTSASPRHEIVEALIAETVRWAKAHHKLAGITTERLGKEPALLAPVRDEVADRLQRELGWRSVDPEDQSCRVRGPFLRFLALGGDVDVPVHEKGVRLIGAFVAGDLDLQGCRGVCALWLLGCWFEAEPVLRDARIAVLSLQGSRVPGLQGDRAEITGDVFLASGFTAEGEVRLLGAKIGGALSCIGGAFRNAGEKALSCDRAEITGDVFLRGGFTAEGEVRLLGAKISGALSCIGGAFHNARGHALACDGAEIGGNVFLSGGFTAEGEVRLLGTKIGGQLACNAGAFRNAGGHALSCDRAKITSSVVLTGGFTAEGEVRLNGAKIGGNLDCIGATFLNARAMEAGYGNGAAGPNARIALNVEAAKIDGSLWLGPGAGAETPAIIHGSLNLQGTHAHQAIDHPDFWPGGANNPLIDEQDENGKPTGRKLHAAIALDGFTYDRLVGGSPLDAETRLRWLARQSFNHRIANFRPQPYEQLVKVLREMGHERDARIIAKERQDAERTARWHRHWHIARTGQSLSPDDTSNAKPFSTWQRMRSACIAVSARASRVGAGWCTGYGYGWKRHLAALLAIWLAGGLVYDQAARQGLMAPASPLVFNDPNLRWSCAPNWADCKWLPKEHTAFGPWMYSFDVVTPIVSIGLERDWAPIYAVPCEVDAKACAPDLPQGSVVEPFGSAMRWLPSWLFLPTPHSFLWWFYWLQVVLGWGLSALLVAVLSGVMKKD